MTKALCLPIFARECVKTHHVRDGADDTARLGRTVPAKLHPAHRGRVVLGVDIMPPARAPPLGPVPDLVRPQGRVRDVVAAEESVDVVGALVAEILLGEVGHGAMAEAAPGVRWT